MCNLFVTSSLAVFEADIIMFEDQKKSKYGNIRKFCINLHLKDCFEMEFTAC